MSTPPAVTRAIAAHRGQWGEPELVVRAPGRVNLIGEHTDYNDGFTLPLALPFDTVFALSNHGDPVDGTVTVAAEGFGEVAFAPGETSDVEAWARYVAGVARLLRERDVPAGGWRAAVTTDIPTGASLSSSAAVEVAATTSLLVRAGRSWTPLQVAQLGQRVENEIVGVPSGIMDQFISAGATEGHASLMDCRALTLTPKPLPAGAAVVVMDTMTRRHLVDGEYAARRASCERAAAAIGVSSLRDATLGQVATVADPVDRRRAHHVVTEIQRTVDAAAALERGDTAEFGRLMTASHTSLRDDFEVSGEGLDRIVEVAGGAPGCLGARMTGGGFAGCAVALVEAPRADEFCAAVLDGYDHDGLTARTWVCAPAAGASVVTAPR